MAKISSVYGHAASQRSMERFKLSRDGRWMGLIGTGRKGGGSINILDAKTCQWVCEACVEGAGGVADFEWWSDGDGLTALGKGGQAVEYSVRERRVLHRWIDQGAVGTTCIALGGKIPEHHAERARAAGLGSDRWLAVGSHSGIVNLYDRSTWLPSPPVTSPSASLSDSGFSMPLHPIPTKSFPQLTTATSHLLVSPDGQLLVLSSRAKQDALRLVHLPSCTVYRNWPTANTPLGKITGVAVSGNSEWLAVGNEAGRVRLWAIGS